ncbi:MAG: hypothetical protein JWQ16_1756 [Novosphingobium sp.]|nr:hypothetical protein [Novosphingobium sp.]
MSDGGAADLQELNAWIADLTSRMDAGARRKLATRIAVDLRKSSADRLKANVGADGEKFEPRKRSRDSFGKAKPGSKINRMFQRAAAPRYLRRSANADAAQVGFTGALVRIMTVHQYGLRDRVSREPGAPEVTYPKRQVLGIADADREHIMELVLAQLSG